MIERDELTMAVGGLIGSIDGLRAEVADTRLYGAHNRKLIRLVAVSVVFDIGLSLGLGAIAVQSRHASDKATRASSTLVVNCLSGNESRKIQADLWNTVLQFPAPAAETPAAKTQREATTAKFKEYIATAFAPRDCSKQGGQ